MSEMVWCDDCKDLHETAAEFAGHVFVVCPQAPPDTLFFFDPRYLRREPEDDS